MDGMGCSDTLPGQTCPTLVTFVILDTPMGLTSGTGLDRWIFILEIFQSSQVVLQGAAAHEVEQGREYDILQAPLREIEDLVR